MSVSEERVQEFDSEEDRKLLISLLSEYAEKISTLCDKLEIYRGKKNLRRLFLLITFLVFGVLLVYSFFGRDPLLYLSMVAVVYTVAASAPIFLTEKLLCLVRPLNY